MPINCRVGIQEMISLPHKNFRLDTQLYQKWLPQKKGDRTLLIFRKLGVTRAHKQPKVAIQVLDAKRK